MALPLVLELPEARPHFPVGTEHRARVGDEGLIVLRPGHAEVGPEPAALEDRRDDPADQVREPLVHVQQIGHFARLEAARTVERDRGQQFRPPRPHPESSRFDALERGHHIGPFREQRRREPGGNRRRVDRRREVRGQQVLDGSRVSSQDQGQATLRIVDGRPQTRQIRLGGPVLLADRVELECVRETGLIPLLSQFRPFPQQIYVVLGDGELGARRDDLEIGRDGRGDDREAHRLGVPPRGQEVPDRRPRLVSETTPEIEFVRETERSRVGGELEPVGEGEREPGDPRSIAVSVAEL